MRILWKVRCTHEDETNVYIILYTVFKRGDWRWPDDCTCRIHHNWEINENWIVPNGYLFISSYKSFKENQLFKRSAYYINIIFFKGTVWRGSIVSCDVEQSAFADFWTHRITCLVLLLRGVPTKSYYLFLIAVFHLKKKTLNT